MKDWIYHGLAGNEAPEEQVGFSRGAVAGILLGAINAALYFLPVDVDGKLILASFLNPAAVFLSYLAYAVLDKWLKAKGLKP
jgi:hypothetical protein